ncbi:hypothetical protein JL720_12128 [Aureococcus anophagefferens]|nr:hypothetical protein JL720_12128 [Aureococcus anophagefferens]
MLFEERARGTLTLKRRCITRAAQVVPRGERALPGLLNDKFQPLARRFSAAAGAPPPPPAPPPPEEDEFPRAEDAAKPEDAPFLYGTHYSTPGYVLFFLVRCVPEYMLCLQNGKFDAADRMFDSVRDAWTSVRAASTDLKELIPEFYDGDGEFLVNGRNVPLGVTQAGERLGDVKLPPWARNPADFVKRCRAALESDYVSARLHHWIDLVFGCKQRSIDDDNVFHPLTYEGTVDLDKAPAPALAKAPPPSSFPRAASDRPRFAAPSEVASLHRKKTSRPHRDVTTDVAYARGVVATSCRDGGLKLSSLGSDDGLTTTRSFAASPLALSCVALDDDATLAVAGGWDNHVVVYRADTACLAARFEAHDASISGLALSGARRGDRTTVVDGRDGLTVFAGGSDGSLAAFAWASSAPVLKYRDGGAHDAPLSALEVAARGADDAVLISAADDCTATTWGLGYQG